MAQVLKRMPPVQVINLTNVPGIAAGAYLLEVHNGKEINQVKFVIK